MITKLVASLRKRCREFMLWRLRLSGLISARGRIGLHVPLRADGPGKVIIGTNVHLGYRGAPILADGSIQIQARHPSTTVEVGDNTSFSNNVQIISETSVTIGASCLLGDAVLILDSDFHNITPSGRHSEPGRTSRISIEDNVFIGSRVIILKGVTIGRNSVVGAGSVVVRSIPPNVIAAGNPTKVIRPL